MLLQIVPLISKSSVLTKSDLYKLDSVKMLERAYYVHSAKMSTSGIEFEDSRYKSFRITGSSWNTIINRNELYDTLQYSQTYLTIFTNKEGFKNYYSKNNNDKIDVLGLDIGIKSYIKLNELNDDDKKRKYEMMLFFSFFYVIFLLIHFYRILKM